MGVDPDSGHDILMPLASARVPVHLGDELADSADAVAGDLGRNALGDRHHLAADDEDSMVVALEELLDDDVAALGLSLSLPEAEAQLLLVQDADRDSAAVIAVERLGDERIAKPLRSAHRLLDVANDDSAWHRHAAFVEQLLGHVLV